VAEPVFTYADGRPKGKKVNDLHLPFSEYSDVHWKWDAQTQRFVRYHGSVPHTYSDGSQVSATNVIVQVVETRMTDIRDANGTPSPEVISVGTGKAYVLRGGKVVVGKWIRESPGDVTRFVTNKGREITLLPGSTWVELFPDNLQMSIS
jgi:hypothetical protein